MIIEQIVIQHRVRCFGMTQRMRADAALGAYIRRALGWNPDLSEDESKKIKNEAARIIKDGAEPFSELITASERSAEPFLEMEKKARREMEKLVKSLPVWASFAEGVNGFGATGLATIIGEAGDLSNYPDFPQLWKRLGLAVINGTAQGKLPSNTAAEVWIEHGYNPKRRSKIFAIGDSLLKQQNPYREIYLQRKEYETDRVKTKMHAHRRAQRYMEKRLIKDLWFAWTE